MAVLLNTFLICVVLISYLEKLAPRLGLLDIPIGRKQHDGAIPVVGGIAIYVAFVFSIFFIPPLEEPLAPFFCGVTLLLVVGIFDDRHEMDARTKLLGQTAAALIMIVPNQKAMVGHLGDLFGQGDILLVGAAMPLAVLFVVATINAFNMIDGLDGVAGGVGATGLLWLTVIAEMAGRMELVTLALLLLCAVTGFLLFNLRHPWRSRAAVFLGDAGSMMIGAILAFLTVRLSQGTEDIVSTPVSLLWTIALPGIDMVSVIIRRAVRLRSPFAADRTHLHHVLLDCGFSPQSAAFILIALAALLGGCGTLGLVLGLPDYVMAWGLALPMAAHTYFVVWGWKGVRVNEQSLVGLRERVS